MNEQPSYINAAGIAGMIFGLIIAVGSIMMGYMTINSEPTGSFITAASLSSFVVCILGAFAGMLAVKLYVNEYGVPVALGKGAVIGIVTGLIAAAVSTIISTIWHFVIDPSYNDRLMEAMIANTEMMTGMTDEMKEGMIDAFYTQFQSAYTAAGIMKNFLIAALFGCLLNMITGILGAKFFAEQPMESLED